MAVIPWIVALLPACVAVAALFLVLADARADAIVDAIRRLPSSRDLSGDGGDHEGRARHERSAA